MKEQDKLFWDAMVEDNADPLGLGRCRVRVLGVHNPDDSIQPVEKLPWAPVAVPAPLAVNGGTGLCSVPEPGSWVMVTFLDRETKQNPIIAFALAPIHTTGGGGSANYDGDGNCQTGGTPPLDGGEGGEGKAPSGSTLFDQARSLVGTKYGMVHGQRVSQLAKNGEGKWYSPKGYMDCSQFVSTLLTNNGMQNCISNGNAWCSPTFIAQLNARGKISLDNAKNGDVICMTGHVAIIVEDSGGRLHVAESCGSKGVTIDYAGAYSANWKRWYGFHRKTFKGIYRP